MAANPLFLIALSALAVAIVVVIVSWRVFLRSLPWRRQPIGWAVFLAMWTVMILGGAFVNVLLTPFDGHTAVRAAESLFVSGHMHLTVRSSLRQRASVAAVPYHRSSGEKRALVFALGVLASGLLLAFGAYGYAMAKVAAEQRPSLTIRNDLPAMVQISVAGVSPFWLVHSGWIAPGGQARLAIGESRLPLDVFARRLSDDAACFGTLTTAQARQPILVSSLHGC